MPSIEAKKAEERTFRMRPPEASDEGWLRTLRSGHDRPPVTGVIEEAEGAGPVGFFRTRRRMDRIDLQELRIRPEWRGRGIGTAFLERLLRDAAKDSRTVRAHVPRECVRARGFLQRAGFATVETRATVQILEIGRTARPPGRKGGIPERHRLNSVLTERLIAFSAAASLGLLNVVARDVPAAEAALDMLAILLAVWWIPTIRCRGLPDDLRAARRGDESVLSLRQPNRPADLCLAVVFVAVAAIGVLPEGIAAGRIPVFTALLLAAAPVLLASGLRRAEVRESGIRLPGNPAFLPWAAIDRWDWRSGRLRIRLRRAIPGVAEDPWTWAAPPRLALPLHRLIAARAPATDSRLDGAADGR